MGVTHYIALLHNPIETVLLLPGFLNLGSVRWSVHGAARAKGRRYACPVRLVGRLSCVSDLLGRHFFINSRHTIRNSSHGGEPDYFSGVGKGEMQWSVDSRCRLEGECTL